MICEVKIITSYLSTSYMTRLIILDENITTHFFSKNRPRAWGQQNSSQIRLSQNVLRITLFFEWHLLQLHLQSEGITLKTRGVILHGVRALIFRNLGLLQKYLRSPQDFWESWFLLLAPRATSHHQYWELCIQIEGQASSRVNFCKLWFLERSEKV